MEHERSRQLRCHDSGGAGAGDFQEERHGHREALPGPQRDYVHGPKFFKPTTYDVVLIDGRQRNMAGTRSHASIIFDTRPSRVTTPHPPPP